MKTPEEALLEYWSKMPELFEILENDFRSYQEFAEHQSLIDSVAYDVSRLQRTSSLLNVMNEMISSVAPHPDGICRDVHVSLLRVIENCLRGQNMFVRSDWKLGIRLFGEASANLHRFVESLRKIPNEDLEGKVYFYEKSFNAPSIFDGESISEEFIPDATEEIVDDYGNLHEVRLNLRDALLVPRRILNDEREQVMACVARVRSAISSEDGSVSSRFESIRLDFGSKEYPIFKSIGTYRLWSYLQRRRTPATSKQIEEELGCSPNTVTKSREELGFMLQERNSKAGMLLKNEFRLRKFEN